MKNIIAVGLLWTLNVAAADIIVSEGELTLSKGEVAFALEAAPPQVKAGAKADEASRYEFFVNLLVSKKYWLGSRRWTYQRPRPPIISFCSSKWKPHGSWISSCFKIN